MGIKLECHFCEEEIKTDPDGWILESNGEVGEFWSEKLQESVLAHPDCVPHLDAVLQGEDPEWAMA